MKIKTNLIGSVLLVAAHALNLWAPLVPMADKFLYAFVLGLLQLALSVVAHYSNPNGSSATLPYGLSDEQLAEYKQIFGDSNNSASSKTNSPLRIIALIALGLAIASPARAQTFAAVGASAIESTAPHVQPVISFATPIAAQAGVYSYTLYEPTISNRQLVTAGCSGLAVYMRSFGPVDLYGTAAPCVAASASATSGAGMAGAVGLLHIGKTNWRAVIGYNLLAGPVANTRTLQVGIGYQFAKTIAIPAPAAAPAPILPLTPATPLAP